MESSHAHWTRPHLVCHSLCNLFLEGVPVPAVAGGDPPHVVLEYPLADGRPIVGFVRSLHLRQLARRGQRSKVDGLEDVDVELLGLGAVKRVTHQDEGIGQPLDSNPDGTMAKVGLSGL